MKRGDFITVVAPGDYGKPRQAIVIQSDWLKATDSILVALLTSALVDAPLYRLQLEPMEENGLKVHPKSWSIKSSRCPGPNAGGQWGNSTRPA